MRYKVACVLLDADDSTGHPGPSVPRGQTVAEASATQVVSVAVNDYGAAQDAVLAHQGDDLVGDHHVRDAVILGEDVAQVAGVTHLVGWPSVVFLEQIWYVEWHSWKCCGTSICILYH